MKEFELDGRLCRDRGDFCVRLGTLLRFPAGFGKNLDALNDCLTSLPEPTKLTVTYFDGLEKRLGDWAGSSGSCCRTSPTGRTCRSSCRRAPSPPRNRSTPWAPPWRPT